MSEVSCANWAITEELELVRTVLACASSSVSHCWFYIPCEISYNDYIVSWYSRGGGGGGGYRRCFSPCGVAPFSCRGDQSMLLSVGLVGKYLESWTRLEFNCLLTPFSYVIIESWSWFHKGDIFWKIMLLEIVWPPDLVNSCPFSNWSTRRKRFY